ncbi:ABC transporter ATP-binding protein [Tumebacillus sp. ITR2]|uniref:ABC transporter ATP-binding protein n=1 Tax=Tumebacillus amylolyticus TaxID=2801339 RepID=A0ABS1J5U9_9BACL|nr:ABC transporter ATP-binding protein [Tumebacillus amylolyticus]MBL0385652.1 ABC transporter ATP-binding protein [Tumebacillus amylolyticus]
MNENEQIGIKEVLQSFRHWRNLFALIWRANPSYLMRVVLIYLLLGVTPIVTLVATKKLIDGVIAGQALAAMGWYVGILVFKQALTIAQSYYEGLFQQLVANAVQEKIIEKTTQLSLADIENTDVQEQLKRVQQEAMYRPYQMFTQMLNVINNVVTFVGAVVLLISWKWWAVLVVALTTGISFYTSLRINQEQFKIVYERAAKQREAWYYTHLLTFDKTFKEIRLFQLGEFFLTKFKAIYRDFYIVDQKIAKKRLNWSAASETLNLVALISVIYLAVREAMRNVFGVGNLYSYVQGISLTQTSAQSVFSNILAICQHNLYIEQLFVFLALPTVEPKLLSGVQDVERIETFEFRDVSFCYPGTEREVLHNVSFSLQRGQCIAIVGRNGSGKTTLAKLITQLYAGYDGEILVNGESVRTLDVEQLQKRIGVVFQDYVHYEMTLRHNIGLGNTETIEDDEKIWEASEKTGIGSFVRNLPHQLDTELGRWVVKGEQLSGGQWQRIAIARAFIRNADLYVLDEPNSALDPIAEFEMFERIRDLLRDRLGIYIAHRLASARFADRILVMDGGQVIEQGTHDELMALDGQYAEMYNVQTNLYEVKA